MSLTEQELEHRTQLWLARLAGKKGKMDRDEIMQRVNEGADLVTVANAEENGDPLGTEDAANIIVCAIGTVLDNPEAEMVDVLRLCFDETTVGQWAEHFPVSVETVENWD